MNRASRLALAIAGGVAVLAGVAFHATAIGTRFARIHVPVRGTVSTISELETRA